MSKKPIDLNVKSGLARLMAAENLTVIYSPKAKTASFNIEKRILILPMLKEMSGYVHDAFISHEVGHALYTPYSEEQYERIMQEVPQVFLNITEDARIEKLIKKKYPGTMRDFYQFYKRFSSDEEDFFGIKDKDLNKLTLINRINLHFKIGSFVKVPFSQEERVLVDQVAAELTFDDAIEAAKAIYNFMKKQGTLKEVKYDDLKKAQKNSKNGPGQGQQGQAGENESEDEGEGGSGQDEMTVITDVPSQSKNKNKEKKDGSNSTKDSTNEMGGSDNTRNGEEDRPSENQSGSNEAGETEAKDASLQSDAGSNDSTEDQESDESENEAKGVSKDSDNEDSEEVKVPEITDEAGDTQSNFEDNLAKQFIGNTNEADNKHFGDMLRFDRTWKDYVTTLKVPHSVDLTKYNEFLKTIMPTINMMAAYFNIKKSAKDSQKTYVAKSGELNEDELSNFKTSEDIFLRHEVLHDSKNHGMVMMIDWSSSMSDNLKYTIKQLMVLMEFCKKTQIPFEVYGFTCGSPRGFNYIPDHHISADMGVSIFKMFSSDMQSQEFRKMSANVYNAIVVNYNINSVYSSGTTPINSMAVLSEYIIKNFKKKFGREKTIFIMLSDGEETDSMNEGRNRIPQHSHSQIIMRDPNTGKNYTHDMKRDGSPYHTIFKYVKEKCEVTKMVGFYLTGNLPFNLCRVVSPNRQGMVDAVSLGRTFREHKYIEFGKDVAFDKYYVLSIANFDVDMEATKELDINAYSSDNLKRKKIEEFLTAKTKPLIFMRKFIEDIS